MKHSLKTNLLIIEVATIGIFAIVLAALFCFFPTYYQEKKLNELNNYMVEEAPSNSIQNNYSWLVTNGYKIQVVVPDPQEFYDDFPISIDGTQIPIINEDDITEQSTEPLRLWESIWNPEAKPVIIPLKPGDPKSPEVLVSVDQDTVTDVTTEIGIILIDLFIFVTIGAFLVFRYFTKKIIEPVIAVQQQVKNISSFQFDNKLTFKSSNEIGLLGEEINNLSDQLQSYLTQRSTLVSSLTHELKNPIAVIESALELHQLGVEPYNQDEHLAEIIRDSSEKMKEIVNFSLKVFSTQSEISHEEVNISAIIRKILNENKARAQAKKLKFLLPKKSIHITGNEQYLNIVVVNLIDNALKYSKPGTSVKIERTKDHLLVIRNTIGVVQKGTQKGLEVSQDLLKENNLNLEYDTVKDNFVVKISYIKEDK